MLPSTGYFKGNNCPFYDSGLCERPYCHFRHVKKETQSICSDGIESGTILQKLVSAAVQKVLQQTETSGIVSPPPGVTIDTTNTPVVTSKVTYNPTPISELNRIINADSNKNEDVSDIQKKHIPIPYTPRKPASLHIKRNTDTNGANVFTFITPAKYSPGSEKVQLDPYTPTSTVESTEKYLPGTEVPIQEYTLNDTQVANKHNYVPSDKTASKKKVLEYKPIKVAKREKSSVTYQPTPRSLAPCFSSDEEEPDTKKRKLSSDLNGLDDLAPEFDMLDQILDEEKTDHEVKQKPKKEYSKEYKENKEKLNTDKKKNDRNKLDKNKRSDTKEKSKTGGSDIKESNKNSKYKDKDDKHKDSSISDKKSSHKKSHKSSYETKEKPDKRSHSSSKSSSDKSKSKSSSSKSESKHREKDDKRRHDSKKAKEKHAKRSEKKTDVIISSDEDRDCGNVMEDDDLDNLSESDEESITQECKRIFEEYVPTEKPQSVEESSKNELSEEIVIPCKKRISRTIDKIIKVIPKAPVKPDFKVNAAQAMAERLTKVREYHAAKISNNTSKIYKPDVVKNYFSASATANVNAKVRIAHVPYASTLITAKKIINPALNNIKTNEPSTSTLIQTVKKGSQRVAHVPSEKFIDRPGVLEPLASKIPANIRSSYLNFMIDHCLKIYLSATDAYARAQHEELTTSKKCSTIQIYKNSAVLAISRLKKEVQECDGIKKSGTECTTLSKVPQAVNNTGTAGSWSIENKNKKNQDDKQQFVGAQFYKNISKWILTEEQLKENGFPRPHESGEKGRAIIYGQNKQKPPKGLIRTCCRCKKDYTINKKGFPVVKEECIYHPNNKYRFRGEVRYQCCSQDGSSDGCNIASSHVYEYVDFDNLKGFVKTLPADSNKDNYGVYSLDCEMCYTTHGLDLTRVTVIDTSCKVVYETLIKPLHPIIDYNTRYSGITEEQMAQVTTTLLEVQATLLTMFNSKTILIGHSLESDFKALKLIHDTVVDTSVLYPHKMGPPYKRALRNLSSEYLKKIIQNSVDGHDSAEDATVCMELIIYKLKEDLKTR